MEGGKTPRKNDAATSDKTDEAGKAPGPFDVRTVKALVSLMTQHDLSEIELRDGAQRLRVRRGAYLPVAPTGAPAAPAALPVAGASTPSEPPATPAAPARQLLEIKSPTPGT